MDSAPIDKIILMLTQGVAPSGIEAAHDRMGMTKEQATKAIAEARRRIKIAAEYDRDEQIAIAFTRLNTLYNTSCEIDPKTALAAQKELNKLLALYSGPTTDTLQTTTKGTDAADELERVAAHLLPLNLAPADYPISEHARLAAAKAREHTPRKE